jgi:hypothetical protein
LTQSVIDICCVVTGCGIGRLLENSISTGIALKL